MLRIEMLPAAQGDCLWIEYGSAARPRRVLIDGGTTGSIKPLVERVKALPAGERHFELLVVTHVDADHVAGVLKFLETPTLGVSLGQICFNAYKHLRDKKDETFGPEQGEVLSAYIAAAKIPWNAAFKGRAVKIPDTGAPPVKKLAGGLELVVLGPTMEKLRKLRPVWAKACADAGIKPGKPAKRPVPAGLETFGPIDVDTLAEARFKEDGTEPNGSSILLLLRYEGARVLLAADGHPTVITAGLKRLSASGRVKLDAYKVAHHGSRNNMDKPLLDRIECSRYLFSSSGAYYKHPDREAIARVLKYGRRGNGTTELVFNYRTKFNDVWDAPALKNRWKYTTSFLTKPADGPAFERP
jgi:beta-lactamase superfamily II metal-dependent hydrolase